MRAAARLGWRIAAVVAFGATAALAVTLTRGAPLHAALTSSRLATGSARSHDAGQAPRCATSGLRISIGPGTSASVAGITGGGANLTRYPLDFTNVSGAACALGGYPAVAAYRADGAQVGNAAALDTSAAAHRVVLAPGATARAAVIAGIPAAGGCRPVVAAGLRVAPPGQSAARYVRYRLLACSATGHRAPVFLRVGAVTPVSPSGSGTVTSDARTTLQGGGSVAANDPHRLTPLRPCAARERHRGAATPSPSPPALASGGARLSSE
jgi:Protein of unknown function (DUF4232)